MAGAIELSPEAKAARRAYVKEWRAANPDKVREQKRRYWERKAKANAEKTEVSGR